MLSEIIELINQAITAKCPEDWTVKAYGLAIPVLVHSADEENDSVYPSIMDQSTGECEYVFIDDNYHCGWYHKLVSKNYGKAKGFGDTDKDVEIAEVLLICWGFLKPTGKTSEQFESSIIIPAMPKQAQLVSSNFDQFNVFSQEFKKIEYNLSPEEFLFSLRYRVQYPFNRECR